MTLNSTFAPPRIRGCTALSSLLLATLLLLAGPAQAQDTETINIPLTRPGQPVWIDVSIMSAHIEVIGENREDVQFDVSVLKGQRSIITPSGAKPITTGGYSLEVEEEDNRISLNTDWRTNRVRVSIRVPTNANLELATINDGIIEVSNINGEMDLRNVNGPITATGVSGSVIAESVNENIRVELTGLAPDDTLSLSSVNGNLTVAMPKGTGAEFHIDTARGEIYSDFEVEVVPTKPMVDRSTKGRGVKVKVESVITALVGGGGPVIKMKSLNGDIQLAENAG